jgi:CO/xanthine dehydrogenase FAD-binding subunit
MARVKYFRPGSLKEAIELLTMQDTIPLAGGTYLTSLKPFAKNLVDLQDLGLDKIKARTNFIEIGSMVKLQQLYNSQILPEPFQIALKLEAPLNIRNSISLGGQITRCTGRSSLATALLAMDAKITLKPGSETLSLLEFLLIKRNGLKNQIITSILIEPKIQFSFHFISRTSYDLPIVCVAVGEFQSSKLRIALGGYGENPILAYEGRFSDNLELFAGNAFTNAEDAWASASYRSAMAEILTKRCLDQLVP